MAIRFGLDIGQRQDPTAMVCVETEIRRKPATKYLPARDEVHFIGRGIGRLPLRTPYEIVVERVVDEVWAVTQMRPEERPEIYVDATGVGVPFVDMLRPALPSGCAVYPIVITSSARSGVDRVHGETRVGKQALATRLQIVLEQHRFHRPDNERWQPLVEELQDFEFMITDSGNTRFEARGGRHDDLVLALALAVLEDPRSRGGWGLIGGGSLITGDLMDVGF